MYKFSKLLILPVLYVIFDIYIRFPLFHLYNKWQLFFYALSIFISIFFFAFIIIIISKLKKYKFLFYSLISIFSIFVIVSFVGSFIFYFFNGFFPNYYTLLYFKTEPESAFSLLKDSINFQDSILFLGIGLPCFMFIRYLALQNYAWFENKRIVMSFLRLSLLYFFLWIYHKKFDQCLIVDTNFAISLQRHFFDKTDHKTYTGKGHSLRHPFLLTKNKSKPKFNVLVIVFESLRKDRIQAYNNIRETSPYLEKFRKEHLSEFHVFEKPYTVSTTTMLAVPGILTGIGPHQEKDVLYSQPIIWDYATKLNYKTFFISSQSMQWYRFYKFYQNEKLEHFWSKEQSHFPLYNDLGIDDKFTIQHLNKHIKKQKKNHFFGVVQMNATHYPYNVPKEFKKWNEKFADNYDNAVLYQDYAMKSLWETLKQENKLENTVIFFVSDHAESLKDHNNIGHVDTYYSEALSIPLMVYIPQKVAKILKQDKKFTFKEFIQNKKKVTSNIDIAPTIIDLLQLQNDLEIKSLWPNFHGFSLFRKIPQNREVITMNNNELSRFKIGVSLIRGNYHYLWRINVVPNREELYNLKTDPTENINLIEYFSKDS